MTVYHLLIQDYIFRDCIDRNIIEILANLSGDLGRNLGGNLSIFRLGGGGEGRGARERRQAI